MMAFGFSIGAQILIARRNGEGNYKEIGPIFYQNLFPAGCCRHSIHAVHRIFTTYSKEYHFVTTYL